MIFKKELSQNHGGWLSLNDMVNGLQWDQTAVTVNYISQQLCLILMN